MVNAVRELELEVWAGVLVAMREGKPVRLYFTTASGLSLSAVGTVAAIYDPHADIATKLWTNDARVQLRGVTATGFGVGNGVSISLQAIDAVEWV